MNALNMKKKSTNIDTYSIDNFPFNNDTSKTMLFYAMTVDYLKILKNFWLSAGI